MGSEAGAQFPAQHRAQPAHEVPKIGDQVVEAGMPLATGLSHVQRALDLGLQAVPTLGGRPCLRMSSAPSQGPWMPTP